MTNKALTGHLETLALADLDWMYVVKANGDGMKAKGSTIKAALAPASADNTPYAVSWDGATAVAPSKNAVYDEMELRLPKAGGTMTGSLTVSYATAAIVINPTTGDSYLSLRGTNAGSDGIRMQASANTGFLDCDTFSVRNRAGSGTRAVFSSLGVAVTGYVTVTDEIYGAGWSGSLQVPTKGALYTKIQSMGSGVVSDTAYPTGWNGTTTTAPSQNAVYDEMELRFAKAGGTITGNVTISAASPALTFNPTSGISTIDLRGTASTNDGLSLRASGATVTYCGDTQTFKNRANSVAFATISSAGLMVDGPVGTQGASATINVTARDYTANFLLMAYTDTLRFYSAGADRMTLTNAGRLSVLNGVNANLALAASGTNRNPGVSVYDNAGVAENGIELGYAGGKYATRLFSQYTQNVIIGGVTPPSAAQADFTDWATFSSTGLNVTGIVNVTGNIGAYGNYHSFGPQVGAPTDLTMNYYSTNYYQFHDYYITAGGAMTSRGRLLVHGGGFVHCAASHAFDNLDRSINCAGLDTNGLSVNGGANFFGPGIALADADCSVTIRATNYYSSLRFQSAFGGGTMQDTGSILGSHGWLCWDAFAFKNTAQTVTYATLGATGLEVTGVVTATGNITSTGALIRVQSANPAVDCWDTDGAGGLAQGAFRIIDNGGMVRAQVYRTGSNALFIEELDGPIHLSSTGTTRATIDSTGINLPTGETYKINGVAIGGAPSDGAYPTGWNGDGTTAPSRNAVYDALQLFFPLTGGSVTGIVSVTGASGAFQCVDRDGSGTFSIYNNTDTLRFYNGTADVVTISSAGVLTVAADAYAAGWNGSNAVPTKDAVYDKIESLRTPVVGSTTSNAGITPNIANDISVRTTQTVGLTVNAPTGTVSDGLGHVIRIKATAAVSIGFAAIYRAIGVTLPTALVSGKTTYIGMIYNSLDTKWDITSIMTEA